jgi:hypothetical protein
MKKYELLNEDGSVYTTIETDDPQRNLEATQANVPQVVAFREVVQQPEPELDLETLKVMKLAEMKAARDRAEQGGFEYMGQILDSDSVSCQRITVASQSALLAQLAGQDFPGLVWICADGYGLEMTGPQVIQMPTALAVHSEKIHGTYRLLKAQIDKSETIEELEEIEWPKS